MAADPRSLVEMITPTDIHAIKRVSRMLGRMLQETERHAGHGETCPFDRVETLRDLLDTKDALDTLAAKYEEAMGTVPPLWAETGLMH